MHVEDDRDLAILGLELSRRPTIHAASSVVLFGNSALGLVPET